MMKAQHIHSLRGASSPQFPPTERVGRHGTMVSHVTITAAQPMPDKLTDRPPRLGIRIAGTVVPSSRGTDLLRPAERPFSSSASEGHETNKRLAS